MKATQLNIRNLDVETIIKIKVYAAGRNVKLPEAMKEIVEGFYDSQEMRQVFEYFFKKAKESMDDMKMSEEQKNQFFNSFAKHSVNWKKELKNRKQS